MINWDPSCLYGPSWISTPDVTDDIQRYFYPEGDIESRLDALSQDLRDKLTVLAERLEFIEHLRVFASVIRAQKSQTKLVDATNSILTVHDKIFLFEHDFAGVDYDIEAIVQYLLLTCIDTIKGDPMIKGGYTKIFVSAFTVDLSMKLRKRFTRGFAVLCAVNSAVVPEEAEKWENKGDGKRIEAIASKLYDIRSRFSHNSIRSFFPTQPVNHLQATPGKVLIKISEDEDLFQCLWDSVVFLARKLLLGLDGEDATEGSA